MSGLWDHSMIVEMFITSMLDPLFDVNIVITMFFCRFFNITTTVSRDAFIHCEP